MQTLSVAASDTVRVPLYRRNGTICAYALLDAADATWATSLRWHLHTNGYAARCVNGKLIRIGRFASEDEAGAAAEAARARLMPYTTN